jgi:hypothetical protein
MRDNSRLIQGTSVFAFSLKPTTGGNEDQQHVFEASVWRSAFLRLVVLRPWRFRWGTQRHNPGIVRGNVAPSPTRRSWLWADSGATRALCDASGYRWLASRRDVQVTVRRISAAAESRIIVQIGAADQDFTLATQARCRDAVITAASSRRAPRKLQRT